MSTPRANYCPCFQNLGTIGIDEVAHKKGHKNYRAVVTARQDDGTVLILTVLKDRKKRQ